MVLVNNAWATRQNYLRGIRYLMLYLNKRPEDCTVDELKAFLVHVRDEQKLSSSSLNLRICGLKYYCREVVKRLDLVVNIPNPRIQKYHTEVLSTQEVILLFNACRDTRQLLVLQLIYETGMRVREVVRLRASDFDKQIRSITIYNGKRQKTRSVPYGDKLRNTIIQYCKARGGVPQNTLIESIKQAHSPISARGIQYLVKDA